MSLAVAQWIAIISLVWAIGASIVSAAAWLIVRAERKERASKEDIEEIERRVSTCEKGLATTPHTDSVHQIALDVKEMAGDMKAVAERLSGVREIVHRIDQVVGRHEQHLLNQS